MNSGNVPVLCLVGYGLSTPRIWEDAFSVEGSEPQEESLYNFVLTCELTQGHSRADIRDEARASLR